MKRRPKLTRPSGQWPFPDQEVELDSDEFKSAAEKVLKENSGLSISQLQELIAFEQFEHSMRKRGLINDEATVTRQV